MLSIKTKEAALIVEQSADISEEWPEAVVEGPARWGWVMKGETSWKSRTQSRSAIT